MAEDLNALLETRGLKTVSVLGWSDGGILGLLLAIHHPDKVGRLTIMGANLTPAGAYPWANKLVADKDKQIDQMIAKATRRSRGPLVMAGDRDVILDTHTLEIFHGLPSAQLAIFPGATHMIPCQNPDFFNRTVETNLTKPFATPDTKDLLKAMMAGIP